MEVLDLADLLNRRNRTHWQISTSHQLRLEIRATGKVEGDRSRLEQVITKLISNAVKYLPNADRVIIQMNDDK